MPDTREQPRATVVFHYPPGSIPESSLGEKPESLPNVDYYRAKTTSGDEAYVAASDDLRIIVRYVMDNAEKIPSDMGVSVTPVSSIDGEMVNLGAAMSIKPQGATTPNGTFDTVMKMSADLEDSPGGEMVSTDHADDEADGSGSIDTDVWFDGEANTDDDVETVVDSTETAAGEDTPADTTDTDNAPVEADTRDVVDPSEDTPTVETPGPAVESPESPAQEQAETGTADSEADTSDVNADTETVTDSETETGGDSDSEIVVTHLVNQVVPERVGGDVAAPLAVNIDRDLSVFPVQARVMVDTLIRQANTLYDHSCDEARADVGYLTPDDVDAEKAALITSLLTQPTSTVSAYLDAITHRDSLVMSVEEKVAEVQAEFQRREDDWVEEKLNVVIPQLRRMFRENYPTTEEQVSQEVIDTARPDMDSADQRVLTAEQQARQDVALRLRHQSTTGRHLSQLMHLADIRATMQNDLAMSVQSVLDAYQAELDAAQKAFENDDLVDSETENGDADTALTDETATFERVVVDTDEETPAPSRKVDLSALIESETAEVEDSDVDESQADADVDTKDAPEDVAEGETTMFDAVTPDDDLVMDSEDEEPGDEADSTTEDADADHPTNGDGPATGGDSLTLFTQTQREDSTEEPSPYDAPHTDPETGEDLDFTDDFIESEDTDYEHDTSGSRKGIRGLFKRIGRNRRGNRA